LLHPNDPLVEVIRTWNKKSPVDHEVVAWEDLIFGGAQPYIMERGNPTAENIARELLEKAQLLLKAENDFLQVLRVRIYETPNCWADAFADEDQQMGQQMEVGFPEAPVRRTMHDTFFKETK